MIYFLKASKLSFFQAKRILPTQVLIVKANIRIYILRDGKTTKTINKKDFIRSDSFKILFQILSLLLGPRDRRRRLLNSTNGREEALLGSGFVRRA